MENKAELISSLDKLHTTALGAERIRRNLCIGTVDAVSWCKKRIAETGSVISRKGKNLYIDTGDCVITVNARSYTIITAHKTKSR
ncbi:MAG: DUF3781 domain-containing protein [Tannerellaceae bacterium]|jgi:hypothetical protein|nr:DUF3781 domain-containing protein [Tannerellaceae bacterium]